MCPKSGTPNFHGSENWERCSHLALPVSCGHVTVISNVPWQFPTRQRGSWERRLQVAQVGLPHLHSLYISSVLMPCWPLTSLYTLPDPCRTLLSPSQLLQHFSHIFSNLQITCHASFLTPAAFLVCYRNRMLKYQKILISPKTE